ncbi:hypothetical protein D3C80_1796230 [compost metagenome]
MVSPLPTGAYKARGLVSRNPVTNLVFLKTILCLVEVEGHVWHLLVSLEVFRSCPACEHIRSSVNTNTIYRLPISESLVSVSAKGVLDSWGCASDN